PDKRLVVTPWPKRIAALRERDRGCPDRRPGQPRRTEPWCWFQSCSFSSSAMGTVLRRNPRRSRKLARYSRCSSQAVQTLRRSGVWSLGLFHTRAHTASARHPRREQCTSALPTVDPLEDERSRRSRNAQTTGRGRRGRRKWRRRVVTGANHPASHAMFRRGLETSPALRRGTEALEPNVHR